MNNATKQKLAIAGAVVFVLGAGVYLWSGDRSEPLDTPLANQHVQVVRTVVDAPSSDKIRRPPTTEPPAWGPKAARPRVASEDGTKGRRQPVKVEVRRKKEPPKHAA